MKPVVRSFLRLALVSYLLLQGPNAMAADTECQPPQLVHIKGGTFSMGDVLGDGDRAMLAETPVHEVDLGSFWLSPYEVTVAEFRRFINDTGYKTLAETDGQIKATKEMIEQGKLKYPTWTRHWFRQTDQDPVLWIAWEDAIVYCNWLSKQSGLSVAYNESTGQLLGQDGKVTSDTRQVKGYRLPTEAEWEYAARERGKRVRFGNGKNQAKADEVNFDARKADKAYTLQGQYRAATTPVGQFAPNALGLYDMSGNAWEWCTDSGVDYPNERVTNPYALHEGGHMARGGTWDSTAEGCRVTTRINWWPKAMCSATGFRVARTADTPPNAENAAPIVSKPFWITVHIRNEAAFESLCGFFKDDLQFPVFFGPEKWGKAQYTAILAGNVVLEICGPYPGIPIPAEQMGRCNTLIFRPCASAQSSVDEMKRRGIPCKGPSESDLQSVIVSGLNLPVNITATLEPKPDSKLPGLSDELKARQGGPLGMKGVKEIYIGYDSQERLDRWINLLKPAERKGNLWRLPEEPSIRLVEDELEDIRLLVFRVRSLEKATEYLKQQDMLGNQGKDSVEIARAKTGGLRIILEE